MTEAEIRQIAIGILAEIAPDTDPASLADGQDLREALDIDSMDFLNFVAALHQRTDIEIPEADYPKLFTLDGVTRYLAQ